MQVYVTEPLVLVIDDEPGIVDFIEVGLREEGYAVVAVATAAEGLRTLRARNSQVAAANTTRPNNAAARTLPAVEWKKKSVTAGGAGTVAPAGARAPPGRG